MFFVYALYSVNFNRIYIGMSQNPSKRLAEHNAGKTKSTKAFIPWILVFQKETESTANARELEKYYKTTTGRRIIKEIIDKL